MYTCATIVQILHYLLTDHLTKYFTPTYWGLAPTSMCLSVSRIRLYWTSFIFLKKNRVYRPWNKKLSYRYTGRAQQRVRDGKNIILYMIVTVNRFRHIKLRTWDNLLSLNSLRATTSVNLRRWNLQTQCYLFVSAPDSTSLSSFTSKQQASEDMTWSKNSELKARQGHRNWYQSNARMQFPASDQ